MQDAAEAGAKLYVKCNTAGNQCYPHIFGNILKPNKHDASTWKNPEVGSFRDECKGDTNALQLQEYSIFPLKSFTGEWLSDADG
jgi:hypothetical protein